MNLDENAGLQATAREVLGDLKHSVVAHELARGVLRLTDQLQYHKDLFSTVMDPAKAATMSGPGGKLYPITADGMREVIDLAGKYKERLRTLSRQLNSLRADIDGTLHPAAGMARQENPEQLL